jgi:hypothetical protein
LALLDLERREDAEGQVTRALLIESALVLAVAVLVLAAWVVTP